jgi:hypothetical protein
MLQNLLRKSSMYAALTLLLFSCRQPIDLDTDRTVVATNLPEITDFSPKVGWLGDRITITGKNFVNVQKVMLDTLTLDSIIVENRNRMSARIPNHILQGAVNTSRTYKISVTTSIGVAEAQQKIALSVTSITGFISLNEQPLDSVVVVITYVAKNLATQTLTGYGINMKSPGFYDIWSNNINTGSNTNIPNGSDFTIRPFLSGYAFSPAEQTVIIQNGRTVGETEFKASKVPTETMPTVTSISPNTASSFSGGTETGITIVLGGKGFTGVRKVMLGIPYPASPGSLAVSVGYTEATAVTINSDNQITVTLPRLDRTTTVSGKTYTNCHIYLLRDDASLLAPQRVSITYI